MSPPLLTFLKYIFLAVLYLFFLRVLRAVWIELREPKVATPEAADQSVFDDAFASAPGAGRSRGGRIDADAEPATTAFGGFVQPRLVVTAPLGRAGVSYPLTGEMTVGRAPGCGISLPDDTFVSQVHARLFHRDGEWWVEDLGSTNGTFHNGGRVTSAVVMRAGDRVQFGQTFTELQTSSELQPFREPQT